MRAHQPGSTPIDIPETVPNPAYTPAPAPERAPTKVPEKVPEKVISGIADATSNGGLNARLLISDQYSQEQTCRHMIAPKWPRFSTLGKQRCGFVRFRA